MKNKIFLITLLPILLNGCLKDDNLIVNETQDLQLSALILREAEERGDFINSSRTSLFPNFITAEQLHNDLQGYNIIDVRNISEFEEGHIPNSVNLNETELFDFVSSQSSLQKKFVIISNSGQAAAYYSALFRIRGINNVYSLLFGIASWNKDFEKEITNYIYALDTLGTDYNINEPVKKYNLPEINPASGSNAKEVFISRIKNLFNEGFIEKPFDLYPEFIHSTINTINFAELFNNFDNYFVICYGTSSLYVQPKGWMGHPYGAVNFFPFAPQSDLNSGGKLQNIPTDKKIAVYSYSGQLSAMLVAYLRLLGYDAKSVLFGGISRRYDILKLDTVSSSSVYIFRGAADYVYEK